MRVEDPAALAEFVLAGEPGWTRQEIAGAMEGERSTRVDLTHTLPVIITYLTAWPRGDGEVVFCEDLYGLDAAETLTAPPAPAPTLISAP